MKKFWLICLSILVIALAFVAIGNVNASGDIPDGIELFYPDDNFFCVVDDGVFQDCFSCCNNDCSLTTVEKETVVIKETSIPNTPVPIPTENPIKYFCHVPPGNPENKHTIGCNNSACISTHLSHHDDYYGKCE